MTLNHDTHPNDNDTIRDAILRLDLASFIGKVFQTVDPGTEFTPNWHINLIADRLEQATERKIRRLIINMPPRSLKSVCVSVAWPAWILGNNPAARVMVASYSQALSLKHSQDCRLVMESPWYQAMFPETLIAPGENQKAKFVTTERGFRLATSVGGVTTGEGGDFLIVDDPHNAIQANSDRQRQAALDWFDQAFMSRMNNKRKGVIVVVMQRLHVGDLTGHLLSKKGTSWEHLSLPAIAEDHTEFTIKNTTKIRKIGDILHNKREDTEALQLAKIELGSSAFMAQYQQQPIAKEGGMLRLSWLQRFSEDPGQGSIYQSWDTATKIAKSNDFSVCTTWRHTERAYYLLDVLAKRMEYPELKRAVLLQAELWKPSGILIEDKASGQALLQDIRLESTLPLIAIRPSDDKVTRFSAITALVEAGKVYLPEHAPWLAECESQLMAFPSVPHDDIVDSFSQFLNWMRTRSGKGPRIRVV